MTEIRGVVERITYQNPDNGYSVLKVAVKGYGELVTVIGNLIDAIVGSVFRMEGEWKYDKKYGDQFYAQKWQEVLPADAYGMEKYLGSGLIKGIGPKYAGKIVSAFGVDTFSIIEESPERLNEVPGIGSKRIKLIAESWNQQKEIRDVMMFLQNNNVSTSYAAKIYKEYGKESIKIVKENPYRLADDVWGIGFKTADSIAESLGISKSSFIRCRSGIFYTLNQLVTEGHVYASEAQLISKAVDLLNIEPDYISDALNKVLEDDELILDGDAIYLPFFYNAETGIAKRLKLLNEFPSRINTLSDVDIDELQDELGIEYDEIQAEGIKQSVYGKVMVLTGGPGTGKTTTTLGIIRVLEDMGMKIVLAAPTGRAAKRMTETTGKEAKTIHRLLEYRPPAGYLRDESNPIEGDVLVVDESSMIDTILLNSLLKAVPPHMKLILVGDIDQLPSVGAGNVLRDIIDSEQFPVIRLTKIFRQAQSSRIIMNAHRINTGHMPDLSNGKNTDFYFVEEEEPEKAAAEIVELMKDRLPNYCNIDPRDIQVLTPMQRGDVGVSNLNKILQDALNPNKQCLYRAGRSYRENDKVMQIKNNYDKGVFNGDIGTILNIDFENKTITVVFDNRLVEYEASELDELVLAYAITIHKSQGSEYPVVIMPIMMTHYIMLQRNLIYTGITRAKKMLVLVGTKKSVSCAVSHISVTKRNTKLKERLMTYELS